MSKTNLSAKQHSVAENDLKDATMPTRTCLPDTRQSITHHFTIGKQEGYFTVGLFEDGKPGELFIKMAKQGSTISGFADAVGILTSLALQYGVPAEALTRKFEYMRFKPSGWTTNEEIRNAHSVVDYIFRWMGLQFSETYRELQNQGRAALNADGKEASKSLADCLAVSDET